MYLLLLYPCIVHAGPMHDNIFWLLGSGTTVEGNSRCLRIQVPPEGVFGI